ncbi:hypothetical protein ZWY2020_060128 [Hordeum vulgare]|nr:hypothetical protein ZWY2020_060128 [Hordeum vulgare]
MDPQPILDFDLNEAPPSDDGGLTVHAQTAPEPSPSLLDQGGTDDDSTAARGDILAARKPSPPPPEVGGTAYALTGREPLRPPPQDDGIVDGTTWRPEMLDLDVSISLTDDDEDDDEEVQGEIESQPPSSYDLGAARSPAHPHSAEKMAKLLSCVPRRSGRRSTHRAALQPVRRRHGAARPSSCADVDSSPPLSRRYDERSSRRNSETSQRVGLFRLGPRQGHRHRALTPRGQ